VFFYLIEIILAGLIIAFILASDPLRSYILFGTISLGIIGIIIEMAVLYHSGVDLSRSSKVHPEAITSQENNSLEAEFKEVKKHSRTGATKKSYF
jgi:xanthine/uracil/vitamin C permease (AzgA family)